LLLSEGGEEGLFLLQ